MATRFYFPETETTPVTPTIDGADWEHVNTLRRELLTVPDGSTLTSTAYTPDAADHLVNGDAHHRQYVSDPLVPQTLAGNVKMQVQGLEANAGNNVALALKVYVVSNDGTSVRGTLLAITRDAAGTFELATSLTNRQFASTALSSVGVLNGDRLVVEIGVGGTPTASGGVQGHNATLRWGCSASGGDLPENDSETGTTFRPWIEFSQTVEFPPPYGVTIMKVDPLRRF